MMTLLQTFSKKLTFLTGFFAGQCTPLNNFNKLSPLYLKTDKNLCNLSINESDISTINNLDPSKSHGWDNLSVRMIKLCGDSLIYPLKCIFEGGLQEGKS